MSLKIADMVFIPQGVYLFASSDNIEQNLTITAQPNYGIILLEKQNTNIFKDLLLIAIGDIKYYVKEEDVFPCL